MTPAEIKVDCYRTWLLCLAELAARRGHGPAEVLFERLKQQHGVA